MHLRTEIGLSIAALLVVQLSTSFAAVGLLSRMSPAVERIVEENLHSEEAALDMRWPEPKTSSKMEARRP